MTTIYRFPDGSAVEASSPEEAADLANEILNLDPENEEEDLVSAEDASPEEVADFFDFEEKYGAVTQLSSDDSSQYLLETYGDDFERVKSTYTDLVWTVVDGDDGLAYIIPGLHFVNRIGYIISNKPWKTTEELFLW